MIKITFNSFQTEPEVFRRYNMEHQIAHVMHQIYHVMHQISHVMHQKSHVMHQISHVMHQISHVMHQISHVMHQISHVMHQISHVMHQISHVMHQIYHVMHHKYHVMHQISHVMLILFIIFVSFSTRPCKKIQWYFDYSAIEYYILTTFYHAHIFYVIIGKGEKISPFFIFSSLQKKN